MEKQGGEESSSLPVATRINSASRVDGVAGGAARRSISRDRRNEAMAVYPGLPLDKRAAPGYHTGLIFGGATMCRARSSVGTLLAVHGIWV